MRNNLKILVVLLGTMLTAKAQTSDEVVDKYLEAVSGKTIINDVKSYTYTKSYKANASTDYDEEVNIIVADKKLSRKKSILERDFFYVLNGGNGWIKIPMGSRDKAPNYMSKDLNSKEVGELVDEITDGLAPFVNFTGKGYKQVGSVTSEKVDGQDCSVFTIEKGGLKKTFAFNKSTGLLVSEEWTVSGVNHSLIHKEYSKTEFGLKYPSESVYYNTKDKKSTKVSTLLVVNTGIEASMFVK